MNSKDEEFLVYLRDYITPHKLNRIEEVLGQRTRYFTVVLEDIYKPHNASAVLRTADCFGVQDVHIIEKANRYKVNPYVTRGAGQWVDIHKYSAGDRSAVATCYETLRRQGYAVYATSPRTDSVPVQDFHPEGKVALVFGNEHQGVSEEAIAEADGLLHIPMYGFTESFNISVSASIFLFELLRKVRKNVIPVGLSDQEKQELRLKWYQEIVKKSEVHKKVFYEGDYSGPE